MSQTAMTKADKKAKNELRDTIVVIIEALLIALVFRTFLWQPFSIPTASMQSTLMIGDYFVADKWIWGLGKYSFPIPLGFNNRILAISEPQRGDIAVFHNEPTNEDYIKRIMGLPGDHIQMKEGRLYINGQELPRVQVGTGTDVAMHSAGITLVQGDLRGIVRARALSRAVLRNIRQNLVFAFAYNALGVPIAAGVLYPITGMLLSPMLAGAAMSFSSVSVIANALRLRKVEL